MLAMGFGLFWLIWILFTTVKLGMSGLSLSLFTQMTPPPGSDEGGLANAIFGSLIVVTMAVLIGTPIGLFAGIYLAEFGKTNWLGKTTRFVNDLLLSAPSIIIGLFVYEVYVAPMGKFSGMAGVFALSLIVIPVVIRTTENMLVLVPNAMREGSLCAGCAEVGSGWTCDLACIGRRCDDRRAAGDCPDLRRNRAVVVHRAVQPVLELQPQRTDGDAAGCDLQVCHEPLPGLAGTGLGGRIPDYPGCAEPEYPGARPVPRQAQAVKTEKL